MDTKGKTNEELQEMLVALRHSTTPPMPFEQMCVQTGIPLPNLYALYKGEMSEVLVTWRDPLVGEIDNSARDAEACRLYKSGLSSHNVADELSMGNHLVLKILKDNGVTIRQRGATKKREDDTINAQVVHAYVVDLMSAATIARAWKMSPKTVWKILDAAGVPHRPAGNQTRKQQQRRELARPATEPKETESPAFTPDYMPLEEGTAMPETPKTPTTTKIVVTYAVRVEETFEDDAELAEFMSDFDWRNATEVQITRT